MCIPDSAPDRCQQISQQQHLPTATRAAATNTNTRRPNFNEPFRNFDSNLAGDREEDANNGRRTLPQLRQDATLAQMYTLNEPNFDLVPLRYRLRRRSALSQSCPLDKEYADLRLIRQFKLWISIKLARILPALSLNQYFFKRIFVTSSEIPEQTGYYQSTTTYFDSRPTTGCPQLHTNSDRSVIMSDTDHSERLRLSSQSGSNATGHGLSGRLYSEKSESPESERSAKLELLSRILRWAGSLALILLISNVIVLFKIFDHNAVREPNLQISSPVSSPLKLKAHDDTVEQQHSQQKHYEHQLGVRGQTDLMMSGEFGLAVEAAEAAEAEATSRWQQAYDKGKNNDDASTMNQPELMSTDRREQVEREYLQEHDHAKHSSLLGAEIYYYLLIVALMDLLSHLNWYHSKQAYKQSQRRHNHSSIRPSAHQHQQRPSSRFATTTNALTLNSQAQSPPPPSSQPASSLSSSYNWFAFVKSSQTSWLTSSILLFTRSKHLFQFLQVSLFVMLDSRPIGKLVILMTCLNYLNQTGRFALYLCRILYYLKTISRESVTKVDSNDYSGNRNDHSANYLFDYPSLSGQATFEGHVSGWLTAMGQNSNLSKIEQYLMMSRIFQIQLTIIALFVHLDSLPIEYSFEVIVLICCIAQAFLEMYFQYDKYYTKYLYWSMANEIDDNDTESL